MLAFAPFAFVPIAPVAQSPSALSNRQNILVRPVHRVHRVGVCRLSKTTILAVTRPPQQPPQQPSGTTPGWGTRMDEDLQAKAPKQDTASETASGGSNNDIGSEDNNGDGKGSGKGNGHGHDDSSQPENEDGSNRDYKIPSMSLPILKQQRNELAKHLQTMGTVFKNGLQSFFDAATVIPIPILTAIVTAIASVSGIRIKTNYDANNKDRDRQAAVQERKRKTGQALRQSYDQISTPILQAAAKLADRLHLLLDMEWDTTESLQHDLFVSPIYSAYLTARYFCTVEIIKNERPLLDYGFPAADRVLYNILGRLQGLFCANDMILEDMQKTELYFKPPLDGQPLPAGLMEISPRSQCILGESLLRRVWTFKYDFLDVASGSERAGTKAILSFREFSRIFNSDESMQQRFQPLVNDFTILEEFARQRSREDRRCPQIGSRVFFIQSALLDLVGFFDPLPDTRTVPAFRRRRVQISLQGNGVIQRWPLSLLRLFRELASIRDHKGVEGDPEQRLALPYDVEVYVTGRHNTGSNELAPMDVGECPTSQRVLLVLNEMKIPHKAVTIIPDSKPSWYYLLHPDNRTPLLYHNGHVLDDPSHIIAYLRNNFPERSPLASAAHLDLRLNTKGLTRFHQPFIRWLAGDDSCKANVERELRALDRILQTVKTKNKGRPFVGGKSFSNEDTAMIPFLHHIDVAGRVMKNWRIPVECKTLNAYLTEARKMPSFIKTVPSNESVVEGYGDIIKGGKWSLRWRLADLL